jgi:hypothetical protein
MFFGVLFVVIFPTKLVSSQSEFWYIVRVLFFSENCGLRGFSEPSVENGGVGLTAGSRQNFLIYAKCLYKV